MRQYTHNDGIRLQYTDAVWFAFLPCIIKVSGGSTSRVELEVTDGEGTTLNYAVDAFKASCVIEYREYAQSFFDGIVYASMDYTKEVTYSRTGKELTVGVKVYSDSGTLVMNYRFTTFFVWGALRQGETWNGYKRLTYFRNYPFSFGLYTTSDVKILVSHDDMPNKYVELAGGRIGNVNGSLIPKGARHSTIYLFWGTIEQATFDNHFDLTFSKASGTQQELMRIDISDADKGTYLRWIDRHGFLRYWLFTEGDEKRIISSGGQFIRDNLTDYPSGRRQSYEREDEVALCAPLVDRYTFDFLQDLASSPVVERFLGGDSWEPVTIKAGSYTKTTAELQDFVCNLVINNTNIQSL
nr:MAG TPA: hypothetical protein [Caudoviricetes sp.]